MKKWEQSFALKDWQIDYILSNPEEIESMGGGRSFCGIYYDLVKKKAEFYYYDPKDNSGGKEDPLEPEISILIEFLRLLIPISGDNLDIVYEQGLCQIAKIMIEADRKIQLLEKEVSLLD